MAPVTSALSLRSGVATMETAAPRRRHRSWMDHLHLHLARAMHGTHEWIFGGGHQRATVGQVHTVSTDHCSGGTSRA